MSDRRRRSSSPGSLIGYLIGTFPSADRRHAARDARRRSTSAPPGAAIPAGSTRSASSGKQWGVVVIVLDTRKGALAGFVGLAIGDAGAYAAGDRGDRRALLAGVEPVPGRQGRRHRRRLVRRRCSRRSSSIGAVFAGVTAFGHPRPALTIKLVTARCGWRPRSPGGPPTLDTWWGPAPAAGLLVYSVLGAAMVLARFRTSGPCKDASCLM